MASNGFENAAQKLPLFDATPDSILIDTQRLIKETRTVQDEVVKMVHGPQHATFDNTLQPLAHQANIFAEKSHMLRFYSDVSPNLEMRRASNEAGELLNDFEIDSVGREDIFHLIDAVYKNREREDLGVESCLLLEQEHHKFISNGLGLSAAQQRDNIKGMKKRLSQLSTEFQKNLNEEDGGIWFTREELEGVPNDVLEGAEKREEHDLGKLEVRLTFQSPDYFAVMNHARHDKTRKRMFLENENKCVRNVPILKEALVLRNEIARLLGYNNHAAYRLSEKMVKSPTAVNNFLADLRANLTNRGCKEIEKLKQIKEHDVGVEHFNGHYYLWDHRYYHSMLLKTEFMVDQEKVSEFFALHTAVRGMLSIFEKILGLRFTLYIDPRGAAGRGRVDNGLTWHEDVQLYSVRDDETEGGGFVGYLYMDLHPRPGKFSHIANLNIQPGFVDGSGNRRYPATVLVCNFAKATSLKPSLLRHEDLVLLFHELGHGIHDLVSKTNYACFHGTMTAQDFCEAPSQMLENWCWTPSVLKSLSQHYITQEKIADRMIESLIRSKDVSNGLFYLRQLHVSIFDMMVHQPDSDQALKEMDISKRYTSLWENITHLEGPNKGDQEHAWGHGEAGFFHLMGDYDAGYYGYLISKVFAQDIFHEAFKRDPMSVEQGRRYRKKVLEKGGSQPEMKTLVDFLGRDPSADAFFEELGLSS